MNKKVLKFGIASGLLFSSCLSLAFEAKTELQNKLAAFEGFSADFSQVVTDFEGNEVQTSGGDLAVLRPNFIYWNTTINDESLIVSDGDTLWYYDPNVEQVTAYSLQKATQNTPLLLLSNIDAAAWDKYQVSKLETGEYLLNVEDEESQIKSLKFAFEDRTLNKFTVIDATEQTSVFTLTNVNTRKLPEKSIFEFKAPKDALIVDEREH